jgi:hypothetical protein
MTTIDESIERADGGIINNITVIVQQPAPATTEGSLLGTVICAVWFGSSILMGCLGGLAAGIFVLVTAPLAAVALVIAGVIVISPFWAIFTILNTPPARPSLPDQCVTVPVKIYRDSDFEAWRKTNGR